MSAGRPALRCPACGHAEPDVGSDAVSCGACGSSWPVRGGILCFQREFDDYSENYDRIAADDLVEEKTPAVVKQDLAELIFPRAGGVVCDLGCGDGFVLRRIEADAKIAVDIALAYLELLPDDVLRLWSRVENVPLADASVDTVVCTDVLEHVLDAGPLAAEIDRLLAPGGRALLAFPFEQDLGVYDLPEYRRKYAKYKYVHVRSIDDHLVRDLFPGYDVRFEQLITSGMPLMEFKPFPIKLVELVRSGD